MGLHARVLMIGPFTAALVPHLPRPPDAYAGLREGATIVEALSEAAPGSSSTAELAEALGVDPWDFAAHHLSPNRVDREKLAAVISSWGREADPVIARLNALAAAGFRFFFRPEG